MFAIARDAAATVARVYHTNFAVDYKGPADPVTEADRLANTLVCARLAAAFGKWAAVVSEEGDPRDYAAWYEHERVFFVDPLDGTAEFVLRNDQFVVMIGLSEGGRATVGVLVAPASGLSWVGAVGVGAWEIDSDGWKRPITVSSTSSLRSSRMVVSRSRRGPDLDSAIAAIGPARAVTLGSGGLKGAEVASGRADLFVQPRFAGKRWDVCAPEAVVLAAGGQCSDEFGRPFDYRKPTLDNADGLVMSNGRLHDMAIERLARSRQNP